MEIILDTSLVVGLAVGLGVPGSAAVAKLIKYFTHKEKCFTLLKQSVRNLEKKETDSVDEHEDFQEEINEIKSRQAKNEIYLKLLLKKWEIPYDD